MSARNRAATLLLAAACLVPAAAEAQERFDILIRGGRVVDGTGNPWYHADIGIRGDRIAAVGDLAGATAGQVIEAEGLFVSPGFIDVHTHYWPGLGTPELSTAEPLLAQGITSALVNPDGGGPTDMAAQREELLRDGLGINVGQLVPHGSLRREVVGMADRQATAAELDRMRQVVRRGMEEGAFGLSSGLYYTPGRFAPLEEVIALADVVAGYGGVYESHIRDEADYDIGLIAAVDEVIRVAREAGIPGIVTHVKALGPNVWGYSAAVVHRIERAREQGVEVYADQYPYHASATGLSAALLPAWALAGGDTALARRLGDPAERSRVRAEMEENLARRAGAAAIQFRRFEPDPSIEGRTLADVAAERGVHPLDLALELVAAGDAGIVSFNMHEDDIRRLMAQDWTMTASDGALVPMGEGVPHPRGYGTFPRKIRKYVVEDRVVDLAHAVRSMTSLPAAAFRIEDRGVLRPGAFADVAVFDLERVRDTATFQQPHQLAEGMVHVLVNGEVAVRDGRFTGELPGRVLRRNAPGVPATD